MPTTERTARLKNRCRFKHVAGGEYVDPNVKAGVERARLITQAHKENIGETNCIFRAKGLENILKNITIHIQDDELIVGANTEHPDYFPMYPELSYFRPWIWLKAITASIRKKCGKLPNTGNLTPFRRKLRNFSLLKK